MNEAVLSYIYLLYSGWWVELMVKLVIVFGDVWWWYQNKATLLQQSCSLGGWK